jgi:hypothetical protein
MVKPPASVEQERDELNCEIQELKRQLEVERTKRKVERVEREVELEALQQRMREEFMTLLANQSQGNEIPCNTKKVLHGCNTTFFLITFLLFVVFYYFTHLTFFASFI